MEWLGGGNLGAEGWELWDLHWDLEAGGGGLVVGGWGLGVGG